MGILDRVEQSLAQEKRKFLVYEACRNLRTVNMFALREVMDRTGLERNEVKYIQDNYEALSKKYLQN